MSTPYEPPATSNEPAPEAPVLLCKYEGIRRKIWIFSFWPLGMLWEFSEREGGIVGLVICFIAFLFLLHYRAKNIGLSQWAWLWTFVPLVNFYFFAYCTIVPEGYADSKKLDAAAYMLLIPLCGLLGLILIVVATDLARLVVAN